MSIETIVHGRTKLNFVGCCLKEGRKEGRDKRLLVYYFGIYFFCFNLEPMCDG